MIEMGSMRGMNRPVGRDSYIICVIVSNERTSSYRVKVRISPELRPSATLRLIKIGTSVSAGKGPRDSSLFTRDTNSFRLAFSALAVIE